MKNKRKLIPQHMLAIWGIDVPYSTHNKSKKREYTKDNRAKENARRQKQLVSGVLK